MLVLLNILPGFAKVPAKQSDKIYYSSSSKSIKIKNELIQGKEINIEYNCTDELENKELIVAICIYYVNTDNRFNVYNLRKPYKISGNKLFFRDTIPENASVLCIDMTHPDYQANLDRIDELPIFTNKHIYSRGALNSLVFTSMEPGKYWDYFDRDRQLYPDNYLVFTAKWYHEQCNKLFAIDTLKKDIDRIDNSNFDNDRKDLLLFIANSYINRKVDSVRLGLIKGLKNNDECLNYEIFDILLEDVLSNTLSENDCISIKETLAYNNPDTKFTHYNFTNGSFFHEFSEDTIEYLLTKLYEIYPNYPTYMIFYADDFCTKKPEKSFVICEELIRRLKTQDLTQHFSYANEILRRFGMICGAIVKSSTALNKQKEGLKMINEYERFLDFTDKLGISEFHYYKAQIFEQINTDSAIYFYALAHKEFPEARSIKRSFEKFAENTLQAKNAEQMLDSLSSTIGEKSQDLPENLQLLLFNDGTKLDLRKSKVPVLIYRSSITCSPCKQELKNLAEITLLRENKPLLVFTNIEHFNYLKKSNKLPKNFEVKGIKNGLQINKLFNLEADPSSILIKNGKILLRNNGFNPNNKELILQAINAN